MSKIDYSNVLYMGLHLHTVWKLQLVLNAAAHLLSNVSCWEHVISIWSIRCWFWPIMSKVVLCTWEIILPLWHTTSGVPELTVPWFRLEGADGRDFSVRDPLLWNYLDPLYPPCSQEPGFGDLWDMLQNSVFSQAFSDINRKDDAVVRGGWV